MDKRTTSALAELMQLCSICNNHRLSQDSYTAPGFIEFLDRPLSIEDIPMESYSIENGGELAKDPKSVPWEDSIKNFVLDLTSVQENRTFSTCILLSDFEYNYAEPTLVLLAKKYGNSNTTMIHVVPTDERASSFSVTIRRNEKVELSTTVDKEYLVSSLSIWYQPNSTLILCHDSFIDEYKETLSMMPQSTWSVSCTTTNFIESAKNGNMCTYICPVYSYPGSMETRAVGSGPIKFAGHKVTRMYAGRMNYYFRCIRGCKHSSGRCYDCQTLYRLLISLQEPYDKNYSNSKTIFAPSFLNSVNKKQQLMR